MTHGYSTRAPYVPLWAGNVEDFESFVHSES
jgi:hypothetical protein